MKFIVKSFFLLFVVVAGSVIAQQATRNQVDFDRLKSTPKSDVYLQAFYWNSPPGGIWYDSLAKLAPRLASAGFNAVWYPPPEKGAAGGYSMGYDPYDHFDFGEFDQKGSRETRFGSREELINSINTFHAVGMQVFADAVMRHMNGAEAIAPFECQPYPEHPDSSWMIFNYPYGSGRFPKTQADFIPNYQVCDVTPPYHGAEDPIFKFGEWICHEKQYVKDSLIAWGQYMRNVIGFDGFRLDAVKHIDPIFIGPWLQAANPGGYAVAEYYGSTSEIGTWLHYCQNVFGGDVSMFDFPLRFTLKDMCNTTDGGFWMTNLDGAGLVNNGISGLDVSTFVENHDLDRTQYDGTFANGHDPILTNKDMAYAYTIFSEGRPCVWFRDYFAYGLAGKIDTLIWIRQNFLYGGTTKRDGLAPFYVGGSGSQEDQSHDIYVAKRNGGDGKPQAYIVINDNPSGWRGVWVNSDYPNQTFRDYTGQAIDKTAAGDGRVELWAPPRGYAIYVPDTLQSINHPPYVQTIPEQTGYINTLYSFQTQAGDPNNTSLSYSLSGNPLWLSVSAGGLLSGTPSASDTGTTEVILNVNDPLGLAAADTFSIYISDHPIMDGLFEGTGVWETPFLTADTLAGWAGAKANNLYVTEDDWYYYFGADITADENMNWAFLIMSRYGGGSSESWSRNIVYAHRDLPDFILRGNFESYAELHSRDFSWWNGVGSRLEDSEFGENITADTTLQQGWVEGRILKSTLGNPTGFAIQFYLTGTENSNATFDACPDDSNTTAESGVTTRLRKYAKYGTTGISFANLQWPPTAFINLGGSNSVYGRVYAFEVTDSTGGGAGVNAWVGYDTTDSNPSTWTNWLSAPFNVDAGTLDEYWKTFGSALPQGIYYYATRYQLNGGDYHYGGYSANGGGEWDGVDNVSGILFVEMPPLAAELTSPADDAVNVPKNATLQWNAAPGATTYRLQIATDSNFTTLVVNDSTITTTSKTVTTLSNLTTYYWRVIGKNTAGWGALSDIRSFTTVIVAPSLPTLSMPANNSTNQPVLTELRWTPSANAMEYRVLVALDTFFTSIVMDDTTDTTTVFTTTLNNYTTYFWRVRAMNVGGASAFTTAWKFKTIIAAPSTPALVLPVQGASNLFTSLWLQWSAIPTSETYRLVIALDTNFTQIVFNDSTVTDTLNYVTGLSPNTKYFWKVRAKNIGGSSDYSTIRSFTTANVVTNQYGIEKDWNLISLPLAVDNNVKSALFPGAVSDAFSFKQGGGYVVKDTIQNGVGYWIKFSDSGQISISGLMKTIDTVFLQQGWNLVGAISSPVDVNDIVQIPGAVVVSQYFKFLPSAGYSAATSLEPMNGYWVKASASGKLLLESTVKGAKTIPKEIKKP